MVRAVPVGAAPRGSTPTSASRARSPTSRRADVREHWYEQFLWALRKGAIPAGRVTSNAGAQEHKPATSTINCTVSGTIRDSMDDILGKVHEAGLTLKAGCGIGYEFSTLRPRGAYVSGAGAYTSGPLSFMDIYDKMCFTVSSAGGRRGAQMGTFDVGHPDAMEFIRAKRESRPAAPVQPVAARHRRVHEGRARGPRVEARLPGRARPRSRATTPRDPAKFIWREWPTHRRLRRQRRRPGAVQGLQDPAGAAHVGRHHVVHLRLRRARLRADRPRQRDEQQLVVREHPRHQPLRRAAAAAVRLVPARLGQPDALRARPVHATTRASTGTSTARSCASSRACSTTWSRSTACRSSSSATRSCASAATAWASSASARRSRMLGMKYGSRESVAFTEDVSRENGASPAGKRPSSWRARRARRRS